MASSGVAPPAPSLPLLDRIAIITGATGGIGRAVSTHLVSLGAKVVLAYYGDPASEAEALVAAINAAGPAPLGPRAVAVQTDVSDPAQVTALFDLAGTAFSTPRGAAAPTAPHILVTTAAVIDASYPPLASTPLESYDRMFAVNCRGTFLCAREAAGRLVRGGGGRIVTFSSSGVGSLRPGYAAYAATKAAVETMTRVLAKELKGTGITANAVAPGPIATPMFYAGKSEEDVESCRNEIPLGRVGTPEDVAKVVGFLVSDAGEWVNAQVVRVNGGNI